MHCGPSRRLPYAVSLLIVIAICYWPYRKLCLAATVGEKLYVPRSWATNCRLLTYWPACDCWSKNLLSVVTRRTRLKYPASYVFWLVVHRLPGSRCLRFVHPRMIEYYVYTICFVLLCCYLELRAPINAPRFCSESDWWTKKQRKDNTYNR